MNYLESMRRPARYIPAVIAAIFINVWLVYAFWHGNRFPFADPQALIHVKIYPDKPAAGPHK